MANSALGNIGRAFVVVATLALSVSATPTEIEITASQWAILNYNLTRQDVFLWEEKQRGDKKLLSYFGTANPTTGQGVLQDKDQHEEIVNWLYNISWYTETSRYQNYNHFIEVGAYWDTLIAIQEGSTNRLRWIEHYLEHIEDHQKLYDYPVQLEIRDAVNSISYDMSAVSDNVSSLYSLLSTGTLNVNANSQQEDIVGTAGQEEAPINPDGSAETVRNEAESDWTIDGTNWMGQTELMIDDIDLELLQQREAEMIAAAQEPPSLTYSLPTAQTLELDFSAFAARWDGFPATLTIDWGVVPGVGLMRIALTTLIYSGLAVAVVKTFK